MVSTLANDTIGTGPTLQLLIEDKAAAMQVEKAFWSWCQAVDLARKLRTMRRSKAVDGECFAALFDNPGLRHPIRLDLRLLEPEMIAAPYQFDGDNRPTDGIILDDFDNVLSYLCLNEHPGESGAGAAALGKYDVVPARFMVHLFNQDRAGQCRGIPEVTPALPLYAMRRRYSLAVLRAAENAAINSGIIKTQQSPNDPDEIEPLDTIDLERGMYTTLPAGWEMTQLKAEQPTTMFDMFQRAIIREMARCLNMPFNIAAGDSGGYNYASGRMDHQVYFKSIGVERSYIETAALDGRIFPLWWALARLSGDVIPASLRELTTPPPREWRWDGREHVDPAKEATAQTLRLASGTTHLAAEYAKEGKDAEEQLQIAAAVYGVDVKVLKAALFQKHFGPPTVLPAEQPEDDDEA